MDKEQILSLLRELGDELAGEQSYATINVCGAAAMAIAYCDNYLTDDIDITLDAGNKTIFYKIVDKITKTYNLPEWWIKDDVKKIVNEYMKEKCFIDFGKFGGLSVRIVSEEQLLAMKLFAARRKDLPDAVMLAKILNIKTKDEMSFVLNKYFSEKVLRFEALRFKNNMRFSDFQDAVVFELEKAERGDFSAE